MTILISQAALIPFVIWVVTTLIVVGINVTFLVIVLRLWHKLEKELAKKPPTFWAGDDYDDYLGDEDDYDELEDDEEDFSDHEGQEDYVL